MTLLISFLAGAGGKILAGVIGKMLELKRQKDLLMMNADINKIKALQSGEDNLSKWGKATRRILAFVMIGTFCYLVIFLVMFKPDQTYSVLIDKNPSILFGWMFGTTDKTTLEISAGSLLWNFEHFVAFIIPFYFTKISKGG